MRLSLPIRRYWHVAIGLASVVLGELIGPNVIELFIEDRTQQLIGVSILRVILVILALLFVVVFLYETRPDFIALYAHANRVRDGTGEGKVYRTVLEFLRPRLEAHFKAVEELFNSTLSIESDELAALTEAAFKGFNGPYTGTDSNPPTQFRRAYPAYFDQQTSNRAAAEVRCDSRYLLVSKQDLLTDYKLDPGEWRDFCDKHQRLGVALYQVEPNDAEAFREFAGLTTTDVGVYGNSYVILFHGRREIGFRPLKPALKTKVALYFEKLTARATHVALENGNNLRFKPLSQEEFHNQMQRMGLSSSARR